MGGAECFGVGVLQAPRLPPSCHRHVTGSFPGSFLRRCPLPNSSLSFFFNKRLEIRLAEVTGCVSHPPARCRGGPGGQGALRGDRVALAGTQWGHRQALVAAGHPSHLEGQGTSLVLATVSSWWGHSPRSPHCHGPLCLHAMATTPSHLTTMGHHVPMAWPPPQATTSPFQPTSLPQVTVSPCHSHDPGPPHHPGTPCPHCRLPHYHRPPGPHGMATTPAHHVPKPCPDSPVAELGWLRCHPGAAAPYGWGQHPR